MSSRWMRRRAASGRREADSPQGLGFGAAGVAGLVHALAVAVVSVLDFSAQKKVLWILLLAAVATILGFALYKYLILKDAHGRVMARKRRRWVVVLGLSVVVTCAMFVVLFFNVQRALQGLPLTCVAPGSGRPEYARAFEDAYDRNGGREKLGCPEATVRSLEGGQHQNLRGPDGPALILAVTPERAFVLDPDEWNGYHKILGPVQTTASVGFPFDEGIELPRGKVLELGAGSGNWPRTAIVKRGGGEWQWVQGGMWEGYRDRFGGPEGKFGYPVAAEEYRDKVRSQRFERGTLYFDPSRGILTEQEFRSGASLAPLAPSRGPVDVFRIGSAGGVSHEIPRGKYVEQPFRSNASVVDRIGVIVGLDPANNTGADHVLEIELFDTDGRRLEGGRAPLVNNGYTIISIPPVSVEEGRVYILRVTNRSTDILGFYLNDPGKSGHVSESGARARLVGERPRPEPYIHPDHALAGLVQGRGPN